MSEAATESPDLASEIAVAPKRKTRRFPKRLHHDPGAVKWAREAKHWTQAALAEAIGKAPSTVSEIEKGTRNAGPATLRDIANALNCPISVLEAKRDAA